MKRILLIAAVVLSACQIDSPAPSGDKATTAITISDFAFQPGTARMAVGQAVTFTNNDGFAHKIAWNTVPAGASSTGSSDLGQGQSYTYTPSAAGDYAYQCGIHSSMKGSLVVTP